MAMHNRNRLLIVGSIVAALLMVGGLTGCTITVSPPPNQNTVNGNQNVNQNTNGNPSANENDNAPAGPVWQEAFHAENLGLLAAVHGIASDDVFMVGGTSARGEIYRYDGDHWREQKVPQIPTLRAVQVIEPDKAWAVGDLGGAIRYNGSVWVRIITGTVATLRGLWGTDFADVWVVGGDNEGAGPVALHFNGVVFSSVPVPAEDTGSKILHAIYGIEGRVLAVGDAGLVVSLEEGVWERVDAATQAHLYAIHASDGNSFIAVGEEDDHGAATIYDGTQWIPVTLPEAPPLRAVWIVNDDAALVAGDGGYVAWFAFIDGSLTPEDSGTSGRLLDLWADGAGLVYAVGARFDDGGSTVSGRAIVRSQTPLGIIPEPPLGIACTVNTDCYNNQICGLSGACLVPECGTNFDCGEGLNCVVGICTTGCITDAQCSITEQCVDNVCVTTAGSPCQSTLDCSLGFVCGAAGICQVTIQPQVEVGYTHPTTGVYTKLHGGDSVPVYAGFQGLVELRVTLRMVGFPPPDNAPPHATLAQNVVRTPSGAVLNAFTQNVFLTAGSQSGITEIVNRLVILDISPTVVEGATVDLSFTVTSLKQQGVTATVSLSAVLDLQ